jgi:hypothetical protein
LWYNSRARPLVSKTNGLLAEARTGSVFTLAVGASPKWVNCWGMTPAILKNTFQTYTGIGDLVCILGVLATSTCRDLRQGQPIYMTDFMAWKSANLFIICAAAGYASIATLCPVFGIMLGPGTQCFIPNS